GAGSCDERREEAPRGAPARFAVWPRESGDEDADDWDVQVTPGEIDDHAVVKAGGSEAVEQDVQAVSEVLWRVRRSLRRGVGSLRERDDLRVAQQLADDPCRRAAVLALAILELVTSADEEAGVGLGGLVDRPR